MISGFGSQLDILDRCKQRCVLRSERLRFGGTDIRATEADCRAWCLRQRNPPERLPHDLELRWQGSRADRSGGYPAGEGGELGLHRHGCAPIVPRSRRTRGGGPGEGGVPVHLGERRPSAAAPEHALRVFGARACSSADSTAAGLAAPRADVSPDAAGTGNDSAMFVPLGVCGRAARQSPLSGSSHEGPVAAVPYGNLSPSFADSLRV